ncbi:MAG: UMP kinase [Fusobacteria bacterium]|nr:UMP kinase [Fusobacteriota bacterium]
MSTLVYKRVLLKLSGEMLMGDSGYGISAEVLERVSNLIKPLHAIGCEIGVVIGGGNIFRGITGTKSGFDRVTGDQMGMLATVINALALCDAFQSVGVPSSVATSFEISGITSAFNAKTVRKKLKNGEVVIFGGGTGSPFFTTDSAGALRAAELNANLYIKATKVDGIFDKDPEKFADAIKYDSISYTDCLNKNLQVMDSTAFSLCRDNSIPIIVCNLFKKDNILNAINGQTVGTLVKGE